MKIKEEAEDFIVEETINIDNKEGNHVYKLIKKNFTTPEAIKIIEEKTKAKIRFCGNKDKKAITKQYISSKKRIKEISIIDKEKDRWLKTEYAGKNSEPLSLGSHIGNRFIIRISGIKDLKEKGLSKEEFIFPNYFGEQRFSKRNVIVGGLLLNRRFEEAITLINDKQANEHLMQKPNDFIGALKKIPKTILRLYLAAVQSHEFNEELSKLIANTKNIEKKELSIADQELLFPKKEIKDCEHKNILMKGWDTEDRRFLFREYPEISLEGEERKAFAKAKNIIFDEESKTITFELPKSSYATIFLRAIFLEDIKY